MPALVLFLMIGAAAPAPEAEALGRRLAAAAPMDRVLAMVTERETEELVAAHPELTPAEQEALRRTGRTVGEAGRERLAAAMGRAYAERLTIEELRALVAFHESPVAARLRDVTPAAVGAAMQTLGPVDFKGEVARTFCAESGRLCEPGPAG